MPRPKVDTRSWQGHCREDAKQDLALLEWVEHMPMPMWVPIPKCSLRLTRNQRFNSHHCRIQAKQGCGLGWHHSLSDSYVSAKLTDMGQVVGLVPRGSCGCSNKGDMKLEEPLPAG